MNDYQEYFQRLSSTEQGENQAIHDQLAKAQELEEKEKNINEAINGIATPIEVEQLGQWVKNPATKLLEKMRNEFANKTKQTVEEVKSKLNPRRIIDDKTREFKERVRARLQEGETDANEPNVAPEAEGGETSQESGNVIDKSSDLYKGLRRNMINDSEEELENKFKNITDSDKFNELWKSRGGRFTNMSDDEIEARRLQGINKLEEMGRPRTSEQLSSDVMDSIRGQGRTVSRDALRRPPQPNEAEQGGRVPETDAPASSGREIASSSLSEDADAVANRVASNISEQASKVVGKVSDKLGDVAKGLTQADEDSLADDEDPFGWLVTAGLTLGAIGAQIGEAFEHHKKVNENNVVDNPSSQIGIHTA